MSQKRLVAVESLTRCALIGTSGGSGRGPDTHEQGLLCARGCGEGRSPFAGSSRVSLGSPLFYPPRMGVKGVDRPTVSLWRPRSANEAMKR